MYSNIGNKIKTLAKIVCIIIAIVWIIVGFILIFDRYSSPLVRLVGFLSIIIGPLLSWISSFLLYGYGELIEQNAEIEREIKRLTKREKEKEIREKKEKEEEREKEKEKIILEKAIKDEWQDDEEEVPFYNPMSEE